MSGKELSVAPSPTLDHQGSAQPLTHIDINGPLLDQVVGALLRASVMLVEAGEALRMTFPDAPGQTADALVFEGNAARTIAQDVMAHQQAAAIEATREAAAADPLAEACGLVTP